MVEGNYVGTNAAGTAALANSFAGVYVAAASNTNGGTAYGAGNVISGNGTYGIRLDAGAATNVVQGNYIGTNAAGTAEVANASYGNYVSGSNGNVIGGVIAGANNVISGNANSGIVIAGAGASGNMVQGNFIGTDASGAASLTNNGFAVQFASSAGNNTLGGAGATTITLNPGADIEIDAPCTLENLTLNGSLNLTSVNGISMTVIGGLILNGTMNLGATDGSTSAQVYFTGTQTLSGEGTVVLGGSTSNALYAQGNDGNSPATLTIDSGITVQRGSGIIGGYYSNDSIVFNGTLAVGTSGGKATLDTGGSGAALTNFTAIAASNGETITVPESLEVDGSEIVTVSTTSSLAVGGDLLGTTQSPAAFNPQGTVTLNGAGTSAAPELLEAMSADQGGVAAGFTNNFAYGTLALANNTYVKLVNQSINSPTSSTEAVYADSLIVPAGCTLNLNGLNLYVRDAQIAGTITGGSITQIPNSGPLVVNNPTPGQLSTAGELDNWTFFERRGNLLTVTLDPGSGAAGGPISPSLQWAQVQLLDPSGNILATATDTTAGGLLTLSNVLLPVDGTYTIAVSAPANYMSSTGNYVIAAYDVTPKVQALNVNQVITATVAPPYSEDQWTFSAAANTQVQFDLLAQSASGLTFSLAGPGGVIEFSNLTGSSGLISLPTSGTYTLTAQGTGGAIGSFTYQMAETVPTLLALATPYTGTFAGSGQSQLFVVNVPAAEPMQVQLTDTAAADHVELYARFGAAPTRQTYDYGANGTGSSQSLLIPSADAGAWFILVYAQSVEQPTSSFTLQAVASPVTVTAVTPVHYGANAVATMTLTGAGFTNVTSVELVSPRNTVYPASSVMFDTFTQITATVNLTGVPQGTYAVRVTNADGSTSTLPSAFTVTAPGQANLVTHLILPGALGRHESTTFYIQYANTGSVAMAAPVLLLESTVADDKPLFTLNPALRVAGFWTSAIPQGYSNTVEILASGKTPGVLEPGESVTVPVYYAGMQQPWNFNESQFHFDIRVFTTSDSDAVNWSSLQSSLQPPGITSTAWSVVYGNLTAQLGSTWGGYVQLLDNEAAYLGQLGENITDIGQLWGLAVQQANNALTPVGPSLTSATDDAVAIPGSLSLSFSRVFSSTVSGRNTLGPLGYGWSTPWQTTATAASDGTVTVTGADGSQRVFQPDSRTAGTYSSQPGDTGTLKADGHGGYLLIEANGTETDYNTNGTLNYLQDTNGNRITAGYTDGHLTSLTASSGQSITIAYNFSGLISTVSDSEGRTTTYSYDLVNDELASVTGYNGQTTTYAYDLPHLVGYLYEYPPLNCFTRSRRSHIPEARMSISPTTPTVG